MTFGSPSSDLSSHVMVPWIVSCSSGSGSFTAGCLPKTSPDRYFAAFRAACLKLELTDYTYESERRLLCTWGEHSVDILWDMQTEELLRAQRNGEFIGEPHLEYEELPGD